MDELRQKVVELTESWRKVYEAMQGSPQAWQPHLPYSSPSEIGEVVSTISYLLDRARAPSGFAPTFRIAKGFAATGLNNAVASVKNLEAGQYENLPAFLTYLNQILSGFLTMLRFSDNDESRRAIEGLAGKLGESLALLDTAQQELANKLQILTESEKKAAIIEEKANAIKSYETDSKNILDGLLITSTSAQKSATEIKSSEDKIETLKGRLETEIKHNEELGNDLGAREKKLLALQIESEKMDNLIRELLPGAASAGLAAGFAEQVKRRERTKWIWMSVFLASIGGLVAMAAIILYENAPQPALDLWKVVLQRLPFTGPLIWLGWFSAVQYGNTVRVQEDYAFKEATAKAFIGYKDHMEHLANVNIEDTKDAMKMLATVTIDILSREPLRIYRHSAEDVSPAKSLLEQITGGLKGKSENA